MENNISKETNSKEEKRNIIVGCFTSIIFIVVCVILIYTMIIKPIKSNGQFEKELEKEMLEITDKVDIYHDQRMFLLKENIANEIKLFKNNIDPFLDKITGIDTMFFSAWNGAKEWFSDDKEQVERYLADIWSETMYSDEDINSIIDNEIEQAISDIQDYTSKIINNSSVNLLEKSEKTLEEIEGQLAVMIDTNEKFVELDMGALKQKASFQAIQFVSEIITEKIISFLFKKIGASLQPSSGNAFLDSMMFGLMMEEMQLDEYRADMEQTLDSMAESISEKVYYSIVHQNQTESKVP